MRSNDRFIIAIALLALLACLVGTSLLIPTINRQRVALQFTANEKLMENLPPEYALPYVALGAFRGPLINFLWIRLEDMKQDGKFWEAKQLSEIITTLQPRFPQVWANRAWNLAYNISVATHTPHERWMWVQAGIDLLRDKGIPANPNAILLYKELSWIFLHKIGMYSDDMHRYYKAKLAEEWHYFLGEPPPGMADMLDDQGKPVLGPEGKPAREWAAIAVFRPIARMYDRYINEATLTLGARRYLKKELRDPRMAGQLKQISELPALRMLAKARILQDKLARELPDLAPRLQPLIDELSDLESRHGDPLDRFLAGEPDCAPVVGQLASLGLKPDLELMQRIGFMRAMLATQAYMKPKDKDKTPHVSATEEKLREIFGDPALDDFESRDKPAARVLAYMRALTLDRKYHMDPLWMLELMEGGWYVHPDLLPDLEARGEVPSIPVDWRHPAAHGLYWAALGVKKSQGLYKPEAFDLLNTDRQILHGLQALMHSGRLLYDPFSGPDGGYHRMLPDYRFIDAYHYAVLSSTYRNPAERLKGAAVVESFEAGHENFLIWAVQTLYWYGMREKAEKYYSLLRRTFTKRDPRNLERYAKPIDKFAMDEFIAAEEADDNERIQGMVNAFLIQALDEGLAANRPETAATLIRRARVFYDYYQQSQDYRTIRGPDKLNRMSMPPWTDMVTQAIEVYLTRMPISTYIKARVWEHVSDEYQRRIYDRAKPFFEKECGAQGLDMEAAFPEPSGMTEYRETRGKATPENPDQPFKSERRSGMR